MPDNFRNINISTIRYCAFLARGGSVRVAIIMFIYLKKKLTNITSKSHILDEISGFHSRQAANIPTSHPDRISKTMGAFRVLYPMLHRRSRVTSENKILLYKQVLRPILTYGCPVFCSMSNTHFNKL